MEKRKMKRIGILAVLAAAALAPGLANADQITLNLTAGYPHDGSGHLLPIGSTLVLLVDADNNGFGDLTKSGGAWKAGLGDVVLGVFPLNGGPDGVGTGDWAFQLDTTSSLYQVGDPMLLAWYNTPFDAGADGPCDTLSKVQFGTYRDDIPADLDNAVAGWTIPTKGGTFSLSALTEDAGGPAGFHGTASQEVTPEPVSMLSMLVIGGVVVARRRRKVA
jgi:hypothetical protein